MQISCHGTNILSTEAFSCLLKRAMDGGFLSSCKVKGRSGEGVQIFHLLFAYYTLIFCQASQDKITYLCCLLMWFKAILGWRINLDKSELITVGRVENIDDLAYEFGCKVGSLSSTYVGLPLVHCLN